jgi:tRNA-splicing ligase RtcB
MEHHYIEQETAGGVLIKMWTRGVPVEDGARRQLENAARLPIVFKHIAAIPHVHFGIGATVGSVIQTSKAIIPAAVGVDIGCGMMACKTTLVAGDLPDNLAPLRSAIERAAYKDIDAMMAAQQDLVEVVHTLKQVVCVKG